MRRVLLVAAVALPATVLAVTPGVGVVLDTSNYNTTSAVSYVNAAQCPTTGTDKLHLEWNISPLSGMTLAGTDVYKIYSSNKAPTSATTGGTWCAETDDNATGTFAGFVNSTTATAALQSMDVSGALAAQQANVPCGSEGTAVYVCVHWYDGGTTRKGWATGTFLIQVNEPAIPAGLTTPLPGSSSLSVSWSANPTTPAPADHYVAYAFAAGTAPAPGTKPPFATSPAATVTTKGTSATLTGLDTVPYDVIVVAYSVGGNPSGASASVQGTPVPTAGFWQVYKDRGGVEQGGCSPGGAGALSMLGAASLLALRRRKR